MNNYDREQQTSLLYHSLQQLKALATDGKVVVNNGGKVRTFLVLEEKENKMVLQSDKGTVHRVVHRVNPNWSPMTRRHKTAEI